MKWRIQGKQKIYHQPGSPNGPAPVVDSHGRILSYALRRAFPGRSDTFSLFSLPPFYAVFRRLLRPSRRTRGHPKTVQAPLHSTSFPGRKRRNLAPPRMPRRWVRGSAGYAASAANLRSASSCADVHVHSPRKRSSHVWVGKVSTIREHLGRFEHESEVGMDESLPRQCTASPSFSTFRPPRYARDA